MKYIKINTPLQVVGGFTVNEAIVVIRSKKCSGNIKEPKSNTSYSMYEYTQSLYKDYESFDKCYSVIDLVSELPEFNLRGYQQFNKDEVLELYLSILKQNEYDAEIVDTDAPVSFKEQLKQAKADAQELNDEVNIRRTVSKLITSLTETFESNLENLTYREKLDFLDRFSKYTTPKL